MSEPPVITDAEFAAMGEDLVRLKLQSKSFNYAITEQAITWLARHERSSNRETRAIARRANTIAIAALAMATIGAIAAIVSAIPVLCAWLGH